MSQEEIRRRVKAEGPDEELPPELKAIEAELAELAPREDRLDRERLVFLAGRASASPGDTEPRAELRRWAWPTAFAGMTAIAAGLLVMVLARPEPGVVERIVYVPRPHAPDAGSSRSGQRERLPGGDLRSGASISVTEAGVGAEKGSLLGLGWEASDGFPTLSHEAVYRRLIESRLTPVPESPLALPRPQRASDGRQQPPLSSQSLEELLEELAAAAHGRGGPIAENPSTTGANS